MKRTYSALAFAALMIAALASCKKDDDNNPITNQKPVTSNPNPLANKACSGIATIQIDGISDTIRVAEALRQPFKMYGIYGSHHTLSIGLLSGLMKLPATNRVFTISADPNKMPDSTEMIVNYFDDQSQTDYFAQSGTISYTLSATEKTAKFTSVVFKSDNGETKTISFEVKFK